MKKLIIAIIFIIMISLIIFFCKDYVIRQYFIAKIQNVDYDEYILTTSYNGKKNEISFYSENYSIVCKYDKDADLEPIVRIYDYEKNMSYEYNVKDKNYFKNENNFTRTTNVNNSILLTLLKNTKDNSKFVYKGVETINDRKCYVLYFERDTDNYMIIYLDKELLFTVREEMYNKDFTGINNEILDYNLDLELKQKDLFEFDFEE